MNFKNTIGLAAVYILILLGTPCHAQDDGASATDKAAKELMNPNTSLASLTFRNQYRWYDGDLPDANNQSNFNILFQPVFPLVFGEDENGVTHKLFVRPAFPFQFNQPILSNTPGSIFDDATGLGDIGYDIAYGASWKNGWQFAGGIAGTLPTATGDVPGGMTNLGPEIFTGLANKHGFFGMLLNHQWDIDSWSDSDTDVNKTTMQAFITLALPDNWAVGSIPIMSYDWESDQATIPLNLYIQKTVNIMGAPTRLQVEVNYYPDSWRPDAFGPEWFVAFNFTPVVSNPFQALVD